MQKTGPQARCAPVIWPTYRVPLGLLAQESELLPSLCPRQFELAPRFRQGAPALLSSDPHLRQEALAKVAIKNYSAVFFGNSSVLCAGQQDGNVSAACFLDPNL